MLPPGGNTIDYKTVKRYFFAWLICVKPSNSSYAMAPYFIFDEL